MVTRFTPAARNSTFLKDVIDRQSIAKNEENQKIRTALYASDVDQCQRKVFFQFFPDKYQPDAKIDATLARVFDNGNAVHERLGGYLKREESIDFRDELRVPQDELEVHGRCDGICTVNSQAVVVEFKSINKEKVDEPKSEHISQLMFYLGMMKKLRGELQVEFGVEGEGLVVCEGDAVSNKGRAFVDLSPMEKWLLTTQGEIKGEIIYEGKPNNAVYCFPIEYDEELFKKVRLWFQQVKFHVDNMQVPDVKYYPSKFPCSWGKGRCSFWSRCYGGEGKEGEE